MSWLSRLFGKPKPPDKSFKDKHGSMYVDQEQDRSWINLSFNPDPPPKNLSGFNLESAVKSPAPTITCPRI
ncbi:hypothetical protein [Pontibaca salina]|uniref:Uncharacterized protein n=1 Tax=Pontibaca salina TaxID=2795731 RepID=A0A934HMI7_9RHOB|nr:hypothetical protein [Pontibaca salina]MBI6628322.1 hypothetical protein [Pontibaca salina]